MTVLKIWTILCVIAFAAFARAANPTGPNGDGLGNWKEEWSKSFMDCWDEAAENAGAEKGNLEKLTPKLSDVGSGKDWCPVSDPFDQEYKVKLFYLAIFKSLAGKESAYNPAAQGQNGGRVPTGLFQMDAQDAKSHGCKGVSSDSDLKDPEKNICCALTIVNSISKGKGNETGETYTTLATGKEGIMGKFWQPMRQGMGGDGKGNNGAINDTANSDKIKKDVKNACEMMESGGYSGGGDSNSPLTPDEFHMAQNGGSGGGSFGGTGGTR